MPHRSFWLQEVAGDAPDAPPLCGDVRADVAIVGGGYVGLWTALRIKALDRGRDVAVLEQDICGGGASGRNGGFVLSWWPKLSSLVALCGEADAVRVARDSQAAIPEIRTFCEAHGIDAQFRQSGWLWTATSRAQMGSWETVVALCEKFGVDAFRRLPPEEVARRSGSDVHRAGVLEASAATVQPAALARGLRRVALESGVRIFEHTRVRSFGRSRPVVLRAAGGTLTAEKLVIAANAWAAGIPELSRSIVAITSDMVMTAPIPDRLAQLGWTGGECITDSQMMVDYYHVTRGGRVAFGKGGWGIALGGRIGAGFDRNARRSRVVAADFHRYYPSLSEAPITHDWCGPIDRTPNSLPLFGRLGGNPDIVYGVGWSGNGVGPSVIGGKVLASLVLGRDDQWSRHPLIERSAGRFPPEPIRYIGAHIVRAAVARKERAEIRDRKPSRLAVRLSRLAPAGLEDKT
ncbi:MAG: FAD-dependent oxidoreductase [Acidobacteriota bacterium]